MPPLPPIPSNETLLVCVLTSVFSLSLGLFMLVFLSEFGDWVCGEGWLAIKDLQPTFPVLKAGHPVSSPPPVYVCCVLYVLCVGIGWFVEVRVLGFLQCAIHTFFHVL